MVKSERYIFYPYTPNELQEKKLDYCEGYFL